MADIKFSRDYGLPPAAPFWLVWNEDGRPPMFKHRTRDAAEFEASRLASECPGRKFHVLAVMSTISTSTKVVGQRFDPSRAMPMEDKDIDPPPEFIQAEPIPIEDEGRPF